MEKKVIREIGDILIKKFGARNMAFWCQDDLENDNMENEIEDTICEIHEKYEDELQISRIDYKISCYLDDTYDLTEVWNNCQDEQFQVSLTRGEIDDILERCGHMEFAEKLRAYLK